MIRLICFLLLLSVITVSASNAAETLKIISWNVETEGSDAEIISKQLSAFPKSDAYLLQEVSGRGLARYASAIRETHGQDYKFFVSSFGGPHKLGVIIDQSKLTIRSFSELMSHGEYQLNNYRFRSPLVIDLETKSGKQLKLVTVHLARGNAKFREEQANGLREWAADQTVPIVLAGDCNFDFDIPTKKGNPAHDAFFEGDTWQLIEPVEWIDTNWDDRDGDGKDNYPGSTLDFAAHSSNGSAVAGTCEIIVRDGDFPDNDRTSDHRPLSVEIELGE